MGRKLLSLLLVVVFSISAVGMSLADENAETQENLAQEERVEENEPENEAEPVTQENQEEERVSVESEKEAEEPEPKEQVEGPSSEETSDLKNKDQASVDENNTEKNAGKEDGGTKNASDKDNVIEDDNVEKSKPEDKNDGEDVKVVDKEEADAEPVIEANSEEIVELVDEQQEKKGTEEAEIDLDIEVDSLEPKGTPPGNITGLKVTNATTNTVTLQWNAATNANGYEIELSTSASSTFSADDTIDITATSNTFNGLTIGRLYYYHVRAYSGSAGSKIYSDVATISYRTIPLAPTLTKGSATASSVTLNWTSVSGVKGYKLYRDGTLLKTYTVNTVLSYKDTGLTAGTTYEYTIRSYVTVDGTEVESDSSGVCSVYLSVPAPKNVKAQSAGSTSIIITWDEVEGATSYLIRRNDGNGFVDIATVNTNTYTDTGLLFGKDYYYNVTAISNNVKSDPSDNVYGQALTDAPQNVKATAITSTDIMVTWNAVENASGYRIRVSSTKGGAALKTAYSASTSYKDTGLTPGVGRYYVIDAYVIIGGTTYYGAESVGVYQVTRPASPSPLTITNPAYNQIKLTWSASAGAAGYIISRRTSTAKPFETIARVSSGTTTWTDTTVTFGQYYYYQVEAYVIESGTSTELKSSPATAQQRAVPPMPTNVKATQITTAGNENQFKITWNAVNGGDGYIVKVRMTGTDTWKQVAKVGNAVSSATAKDLVLGESYDVAVYKYFNYNGTEYYGRWAQVNANLVKIPSPQNLRREPVNLTSVRLKWSAVGGAIGYYLDITCAEDSNYSVKKTVTAVEETLESLVAGYNYTARIYTCSNVQGEEKRSSSPATLTFQTSPAAPSAVSTFTGREIYSQIGALLQWGSVSEAQGYIIQRSTSRTTGFADIVRLDGSSVVKYSDVMGAADVGKVYYYRICTYSNPQGTDLRSTYSNVVAVTIRPTVPTNFKATGDSSTTVKLTWTPSSGADGYYIYRATSANGEYKYVNKVTVSSQGYYYNRNLTVGNTYYYKIRAYKTVGTAASVFLSNFTSVASAGAVLNAPTWTSNSQAGSAVQLRWKAPAGSPTGYVIYRSIGTQAYKQIAKVTGTSYKDSNLTVGQIYNYKVAAYKTVKGRDYVGKQSSVWSTAITLSQVKGVKSAPQSTSSLKLTWTSLANVTGYEVQMSTSSSGTYKQVNKTASNSLIVSNLPNATYRYFKVRCYVVVNGSTSYGPWSAICTGYAGPAGATNLKASSVTGRKVRLTWNQANGASGYQIQYRVKGTSTWIVAAVTAKGTGVGTYEVTLPSSKTTYQIRLISMCRETTTGDQRGSISSGTITVTTK